jgi:hypothetical protein
LEEVEAIMRLFCENASDSASREILKKIACKNASRLHDPAGGTRGRRGYLTQTPFDQVEESLHSDPAVQHLDHLFEAESGLFACNR